MRIGSVANYPQLNRAEWKQQGYIALERGDLAEAFRCFLEAVEEGDRQAQYEVGYAYLHGDGVRQDQVEGVRWLELSAAQDDEYAQCELGLLLVSGLVVGQDEERAFELFTKAAAGEHLLALYWQGKMLLEGRGIVQDVSLGKRRIEDAANMELVDAQLFLADLLCKEGKVEEGNCWRRRAEVNAAELIQQQILELSAVAG